jgi:hypothetical protein
MLIGVANKEGVAKQKAVAQENFLTKIGNFEEFIHTFSFID